MECWSTSWALLADPLSFASIGIDLGSSVLKAVGFEFFEDRPPDFNLLGHTPNHLERPQPGWVEIDPDGLEVGFRQLLNSVPRGSRVGFATAMHSLLLVDDQGSPLTPILTWADTRSAQEAKELKQLDPEQSRRTGTPVHPMAWPSKLLWLKRNFPEAWGRCRQVLDQKTYLLRRYSGRPIPMDRSNAGSTGLYDAEKNRWDPILLEHLELDPELLPQVCPSAQRVDLGADFEGVLGAGDGPLANLGAGAVTSDRWALSVGTSAAIRAVVPHCAQVDGRLFRYPLSGERFTVGGALSNGTSLLDWLAQFGVTNAREQLQLAEQVEPGAQGLLVLPYLSGERSPWWEPDCSGVMLGLRFHHGLPHLIRAFLEGLAMCLRQVADILEETVGPAREIVVGGGLNRSPLFRQLLADVLARPLRHSSVQESTALGAAFLAAEQPDWEAWTSHFPLGPLLLPSRNSETYHDLYQRHRAIFPHWSSFCPSS